MDVTQVNMHEAKSRLSEFGELVQQGETVIIAKAGKPYLDLLPHREHRTIRRAGLLRFVLVDRRVIRADTI